MSKVEKYGCLSVVDGSYVLVDVNNPDMADLLLYTRDEADEGSYLVVESKDAELADSGRADPKRFAHIFLEFSVMTVSGKKRVWVNRKYLDDMEVGAAILALYRDGTEVFTVEAFE